MTHDVTDASGNAAQRVTRKVEVRDTVAPVITLLGEETVMHEAGTPYVDMGVSASDSLEGDLSGSAVSTGTVNPNEVGIYKVTYNLSAVSYTHLTLPTNREV